MKQVRLTAADKFILRQMENLGAGMVLFFAVILFILLRV